MKTIKHILAFRWEVQQIGPKAVEIKTGVGGMPLIHPAFGETLTEAEFAEAEHLLIQRFAVIKED